MSRISPAVLDDAATRVRDGETLTAVLSDHPAAQQALAPLLAAVQTLAACREIELPPA